MSLKRLNTNKFQKNVKKHFTKIIKQIYSKYAIAKSVAEPGNSYYLSVANSMPKACFFIRSTRTPQECPEFQENREHHSMVACNGKGFALCCFPLMTVFQPVTRYRPKAWKLQAVTSKKTFSGVIAMIYKFLLLGNKRLTIRIRANSEQEARQQLQFTSPTLCVARINEKGGIYA